MLYRFRHQIRKKSELQQLGLGHFTETYRNNILVYWMTFFQLHKLMIDYDY